MTDPGAIFFVLALIGSAVAALGYLLSLLVQKVRLAKISTWVLASCFAFLTLTLIVAAFHAEGWGNFGMRYILSIYAWAISGIYLGLQFKTKTRVLGAFVAPFILLFLIAAAGQGAAKSSLPSQWQGWLTVLHLVLAIAGEALFVLASAAGAMLLIQNSLIKKKKPGKMSHLLPSLGDLDRVNEFGLLWGSILLTVGMIGGAFYAAFVWEKVWVSDPKVLWSFAVWVVYGILLHQRLAIGWRGARMAVLSCLAFILFFLSALVIRFCFSTVHNFI